jgi:VCBS repeat-containing protein
VPGAGNIVCNSGAGVLITGLAATNAPSNNNTVQGNYLGTTPAGLTGAGNRGSGGVRIGFNNTVPCQNNLIGGTAPGAGNVIAFNTGPGIFATVGDGNTFSRNSIFSNGGLGIELTPPTGPNSPNDPQDPDGGTNRLQNFPLISSVVTIGATTTIQGKLNSTPMRSFRIELFRNQAADPSGFGEGQAFIADTIVTTDANGDANFIVTVAAIPSGDVVTSTATDLVTGDTSEFSGNRAPVANDDSYTVAEDGTLLANDADGTATVTTNDNGVLANDTDADNNALSAILVSSPANGNLSLNADGTFTYTPFADFFGADTFTYRASDGQANSNIVTVTINVTSVNDPPVANDDSDTVNEDSSVTTNVIANDNAGPANENQSLTVITLTQGANGTVTNNNDGTITYTPNANFFGADSYTYTIEDSDGATATAAVSISVASVNDDPVANPDSDTVAEDGSVTTNVVANDNAGPANEPQTLTVVVVTQGANGTVTNNNDGTITYTPDANFFGADSYTYTVADSDGATATATVTITVSEVNDAPVASNDSAAATQDVPVSGNVLANDTDPDNTDGFVGNEDDIDALLVTGPAHGTLVLDSETGDFTYTPSTGFFGIDTFTYRAVDSDGAQSNLATVTITVTPAAEGSVYSVPDECDPGKTALVVNGTSADDDIHISPTSGGIDVTINGISQGTFNPTGRIIVFGYDGNDNIQLAGSISNPAWLYGDAGDDRLNVGNGGGISFGGAGNDELLGGNSRDILVGGDGVDRIVGNSADDILLASTSIHDDRFTAANHEEAWCGIYHEWMRTDHTYLQRVDNITDGTGTVVRDNGSYFLNQLTVFDDNDIDRLTGSAATDWFFANLTGTGAYDIITDLKSNEVADELVV